MAVVDYTPSEHGYTFHRDDGKSMFASGPEADQLKSWIDQTRPPDRRTASFDSSAPFGSASAVPDYGPPAPAVAPPSVSDAGGMSMPPSPGPAMSAAPPGPPSPGPRAMPMGHGTEFHSAAKAAPKASAGIAPPPEGASLPPMSMGDGGPEGAPGTDYRGATRDAASQLAYSLAASPLPSGGGRPSKLVKVEESIEARGNPEQQAANAAMLDEQRATGRQTIAELRTIAGKRQEMAAQQEEEYGDLALDAHQRVIEAKQAQEHAQNEWNRTYAGLSKEQDAAANLKVDPRRLFHGSGGAANAITSAIAVALGAFGSSLTGGPNYAHQIVQASIDRDISAQENDITRKGARAGNAMSNFMRVHGLDLDEAKIAVKATAQQYAAALAQIQAARIGGLDAQEKSTQFIAKMQEDSNKALAELQEKVMAKETAKYKMSGGGAAADAERRLKLLGMATDIEVKNRKMAAAEGESGKTGQVSPRLSQSEASVATIHKSIEHLQHLSDEAGSGSLSQVADKFGIGRTSELTQAAQNVAFLAARAEMGGLAPPDGRVSQIEHNLMSPSKRTRDSQIAELKAIAANIHDANLDVSARTAKIGDISAPEGDR